MSLRRLGGRFAGAILATAVVPSVAAGPIRVRADEVVGPLPAIHGVNSGPLVRDAWRPDTTQPDIDMSAEFAATRIPESRLHDEGAGDMDALWLPRNGDALTFAGYDPADDANWNPVGLAALDARMAAADAVGTANYLRCGHSRIEIPPGSGNFPYAKIPDDFDVWAAACVEIVARMRAAGHVVDRIEVWNEPYYAEFWEGTALEYLDLYERTHAAAHARFGDDIAVGIHSIRGPWGQAASLAIQQRNTDADPDNDVVVDFWVAHQYLRRPHQIVENVYEDVVDVIDGVPQKVPPIEQYFEVVGLPPDLPVVVSEWNRGTGVGSEFARTAAGLPVLLGGLAYMADMHPSAGPHNVVMGHFYSARGGLWDEGEGPLAVGDPRPAGILWELYGASMLATTPSRIGIDGLFATEDPNDPDRGEERVGIGGISDDRRQLQVLVGWFDNRGADLYVDEIGAAEATEVLFVGLEPGSWELSAARIEDDGGPFYDRHGQLVTLAEGTFPVGPDGSLTWTVDLSRNAVTFVSARWIGPPDDGGTTGTTGTGTESSGTGSTGTPGGTMPGDGTGTSAGEADGGGGCTCRSAGPGEAPVSPAHVAWVAVLGFVGRRRGRTRARRPRCAPGDVGR